jgi:TonB-dependent SusC/RagA subfamily outer membrane receptor
VRNATTKMRTPLTILILTLSTLLRAQSTVDNLVLTKEQNDKWISKLEKESKSGQLELIRARILLDTNIYVNEYYADRLKIDNDKQRGKRTEAYGRSLLVFNQSYAADINNRTKNKSILKLADFLTDKKIKSISILKGTQATALYGSRATNGVILLTTADKKTFKQIKEITFE